MLDKLHALCEPYLQPLELNGMRGRQMIHPARDKAHNDDILFIYGIHGNMERFYGIVHYLANFGNVSMPDLPGFGGMDTFYSVGKKPTFDEYADYMYDYIKAHYGDKKFKLAALSYGFVVATRMFQRHPDIKDQITLVISVVGIADSDNFGVSKRTVRLFKTIFFLFRHQPTRWLAYHVAFSEMVLRRTYKPNHPKMVALAPEDRPAFIAFESYLWRINDLRTYGFAMRELFTFHHPKGKIPVKIHHIGTPHDHWLNDKKVQMHLHELYDGVTVHISPIKNHGGTAYDSEDEAKEIMPPSIVELLLKK
jgi:pimeloyl-ACP methyl ester carboxylesterase